MNGIPLKTEKNCPLITVKNLILIYTNRVNAYILPIEQIGRQYSNLRKLAMEQLEKCRVRMREQ